jgi:hypothetical protein
LDFLVVITVAPCVVLSVVAASAAASGRGPALEWVPAASFVCGLAAVAASLAAAHVPRTFTRLNLAQNRWVRALGATASDAAFVARVHNRPSLAVAANREYEALLESAWVRLLVKLHAVSYEGGQASVTALWFVCHLAQPAGAFRPSDDAEDASQTGASWADVPAALGLACAYAAALDLLLLAGAKLALSRGTPLLGLFFFGGGGLRGRSEEEGGWGHLELSPPPRKPVPSGERKAAPNSRLAAPRPDPRDQRPPRRYAARAAHPALGGRRVRAWLQLLDWLLLGANAAATASVQWGPDEEERVAWAVACYLVAGSCRLLRAARFLDALETASPLANASALLPTPTKAWEAASLKGHLLAAKAALAVVSCGATVWACELSVRGLEATAAFEGRGGWTLPEALYFAVATLSTVGDERKKQ